MAMAVVLKASLADTTNGTSYAFGAFTPSANTVLVAAVVSIAGDGVTLPTLSDSEGAWTRHSYNYPGAPASRPITLFWRKVGASPVSITPTFDSTGDSLNGAMGAIWQFTPDTVVSGIPIRQTAFPSPESAGANAVCTFASALDTANGYGMISYCDNSPYAMDSAPTGWTQDVDTGIASPSVGLWAGHRAGGETGTTITATDAATNVGRGSLAFEVYNAEPPVASHLASFRQLGVRYLVAPQTYRGGFSVAQSPTGLSISFATVLQTMNSLSRFDFFRRTFRPYRAFHGLKALGKAPIGSSLAPLVGTGTWIDIARRIDRR